MSLGDLRILKGATVDMAPGYRDATFVRRERIKVVTQIPSGEGHERIVA
jgi:hypothetical protein